MHNDKDLDYIEPYDEIKEKCKKNKDNEYNISYEEN